MERSKKNAIAAAIVAIALIASIVAACMTAMPSDESPLSSHTGAQELTQAAAPSEDGTVAEGYNNTTGTKVTNIDTLRNATTGDYYLAEDITVSSIDSVNDYSTIFSGTFDGNGHTITIDATGETGVTDAGGLFMGLKSGAVIKNLTIKVNKFSLKTSQSLNNVGIIAGYVNGDCTIENVKVVLNYGTTATGNSNQDNYVWTSQIDDVEIRLGGLFGKVEQGTSTIRNVTVENNASGQGFSALAWMNSGSVIYHSDSTMRIGGFVGHVLDSGNLDMDAVTYKTGEGTGNITAIGESTSSERYNLAFIGGVVGYLQNGSVNINGLHLDVRGGVGEKCKRVNINYTYSAGFVIGQ